MGIYQHWQAKKVIPFEYDFASGFRDGVSVVMVDGWWGLVDRDGSYVVEPKYDDDTGPDSTGPTSCLRRRESKAFCMRVARLSPMPGSIQVYVVSEDLVNVVVDGKAGYFNVASNEWTIEPRYDMAAPSHDGVAQVRIGDATGFIDRSGEFTVKPREPDKRLMSNFGQFHFDGTKLSPIRKYVDVKRRQKVVGLIDTRSGEVLIEPAFTSIGMVYEGRAVFEDGGKFGYLDDKGNVAIPAQFKQAATSRAALHMSPLRMAPATSTLKAR